MCAESFTAKYQTSSSLPLSLFVGMCVCVCVYCNTSGDVRLLDLCIVAPFAGAQNELMYKRRSCWIPQPQNNTDISVLSLFARQRRQGTTRGSTRRDLVQFVGCDRQKSGARAIFANKSIPRNFRLELPTECSYQRWWPVCSGWCSSQWQFRPTKVWTARRAIAVGQEGHVSVCET